MKEKYLTNRPSLINEHELFFDDLLKDNPKAYRSVILAKLRLKLIFLDSSGISPSSFCLIILLKNK